MNGHYPVTVTRPDHASETSPGSPPPSLNFALSGHPYSTSQLRVCTHEDGVRRLPSSSQAIRYLDGKDNANDLGWLGSGYQVQWI